MSNSNEARWKQRLENFGRALSQLSDACEQDQYTNLELAGLIKLFEFSFELSWKVLKDLLYYEGQETNTPRAAIRKGFEAKYMDESDCETLLDALDKRNQLSHTYTQAGANQAESLIKNQYHPVLARLYSNLSAKA